MSLVLSNKKKYGTSERRMQRAYMNIKTNNLANKIYIYIYIFFALVIYSYHSLYGQIFRLFLSMYMDRECMCI